MYTTFEPEVTILTMQETLVNKLQKFLESTQEHCGYFPSPKIILPTTELGFAVIVWNEDKTNKMKRYQVTVDKVNEYGGNQPQKVDTNFSPNVLLASILEYVNTFYNLTVNENFVQVIYPNNLGKTSYGFMVETSEGSLLVLVTDWFS